MLSEVRKNDDEKTLLLRVIWLYTYEVHFDQKPIYYVRAISVMEFQVWLSKHIVHLIHFDKWFCS